MVNVACVTGCCETCEIGSDDFDRADNVSLGVSWDVRTTSPEIFSNTAASGTSGDLVVFTTGHPDVIAAAVVEVDITLADDTDEAEIIVNHDGSDDDIYHFVRVRNYEIELYERSGGSNSLLLCASIDLPNNPTVTVYFDADSSGKFSATCGDAEIKATANPQGQFVGLGTGTVTNLVQFDNFVFKRHRQEGTNTCPQLVNCLIQRDDFSRPDSSSLGCAWTESSGTWAIASSKLECSGAGIAIFNPEHPNGESTMTAEVTFRHSSSAGKVDVLVGVVDSSNYYYARYSPAGASGTIELRKCVAGTHSSLLTSRNVTINTATDYLAKVCTDQDGHISAFLDGVIKVTSAPQAITGIQCGLGMAVTGTALFTGMSFSKALHSSTATGCPECGLTAICPRCIEGTEYRIYKVVITGVAAGVGALACTNCDDVNGIYFPEFFGVIGGNECMWCIALPIPIDCSTDQPALVLGIQNFSGSNHYRVGLGYSTSDCYPNVPLFGIDTSEGTPLNCELDEYDIPDLGDISQCDPTGGTCTVTAFA